MTNDEMTTTEAKEPSRAASLALGDTKPNAETGVNWPALVGLIAIFGLVLWAGLIYFIIAIGVIVMIFLHELGHFMTAKWTGMKPTDFFIGFGTTIFSWRRGEVTYGAKALPFGAFVRIIGMNNLDPVAPEDADRAYMNKSYPRRMLVITAGSMMHFLQALIIFVAMSAFIGVGRIHPDFDSSAWRVDEVLIAEEGPATTGQLLGLQSGDRIVSVDGEQTEQWYSDGLLDVVQSRPGETVEFVIERDGEQFTETATIGIAVDSRGREFGRIGVAADLSAIPERQKPGVMAGVEQFGTQMTDALTAIPRFLSPATFVDLITSSVNADDADEQVQERPVSIVGAVGIAGRVSEFDPTAPLLFLGLINCFVGIFNLLPLLPLDGGHAAIATWERIRSRKGVRHHVDVARLLPITYGVVALMAVLGITTIWLDSLLLITSR